MAKRFNIKNTDLYRSVKEWSAGDTWPFYTVSADDFVKAATPLLEMLHNLESRKIDNKKASPEAYMDRTMEATITMLKFIHKMELEASSREMNAMLNWHKGKANNMDFLDAQEFIEYAIEEMYSYNNKICDHLAPELEKHGVVPRYIDMENERTYLIDEECTFAKKAAKNHCAAMEEAYAEIENLIRYGLPSDGAVGRLVDRVTGNADIKENNKTIVDKILSSEADLEIVRLYILPELDLRIQEYEAKAKIEEVNSKKAEELEVGELQKSDPYFFRNSYMTYLKARETIEKALLIMQKQELQMESDYKIKIEKDPETATYMLTAQWSCGDKVEKKESKQLTENVSRSSTVVKEKNRKEESIKIQIGQSSNRLYEETRRKSACRFGYMNRQELKTKEKSLANIFSAYSMRREAMIRRRTRVAGQKKFRAQVSFDAAKAEDKVVYGSQKEDKNGKKKKKEKTIVKVAVHAGSASASLDTDKVVPVVQGSASIAGASAEALDVAKANASLGSVGYSSDPGIEGKVKDAVKEAVKNEINGEEQQSIGDTISEIAEAAIDKITDVSTSDPNASAKVSVGGVTIVGVSCNEEEVKTENKIPDIVEAVENAIDSITDAIEAVATPEAQISADGNETPIEPMEPTEIDVNPECIAILDDIIDMQIFDVDASKFVVLDQETHHSEPQPEQQPVCVPDHDEDEIEPVCAR